MLVWLVGAGFKPAPTCICDEVLPGGCPLSPSYFPLPLSEGELKGVPAERTHGCPRRGWEM